MADKNDEEELKVLIVSLNKTETGRGRIEEVVMRTQNWDIKGQSAAFFDERQS